MTYPEPTIQECIEAYDLPGVHPAAELFPLIEGEEFQELCESIGKHGLEEDVVLTHDGLLLDGRNRLRALLVTGQCERFRRLDEVYAKDYVGFVVRLNIHRRHLDATQRALIGKKIKGMYEAEAKERQREQGGDRRSQEYKQSLREKIPEAVDHAPEPETDQPKQAPAPRPRDRAAKDANANPRYITELERIERESPEVYAEIEQGKKTVPQAKREVAQKKAQPRQSITLTQWNDEGLSAIPEAEKASQFNRQDDTAEDSMGNIEWAKWSWNPVTGCKHDCSYCYARDIAQRFYPQGFEPTIHPDRLTAPYQTKVPAGADADVTKRNVFANSMSDLYGRWVPQEWIDAVFKAMSDNPQWNFLTLTKFPKRAAELEYPENVWIGTSVDLQARVKPAEEAFKRIECGVRWLSIEPMIEPLTFSSPELFDWVVIGGASRSSKTPEWAPPFGWIVRVASQFLDANPDVKIYLKTNGRPREFPGAITAASADEAFHYLEKK